jgi:UPF0042 nucleotide-binding protein
MTDENARKHLLIITGLSGSGKTTAFKALEDLGFFCVDNLPTALIPRLIEMTIASGGKINRLAIVVDVRLGESAADFRKLFNELKKLPFESKILFFDASDEVLARRYSETRRVHPLARNGTLLDGVRAEKEQLADIRVLADMEIDTTEFSVHHLRNFIYDTFRFQEGGAGLNVTVVSFGFKRGLPHNSDLVFDVRFLPNPNFIEELKDKTGHDRAIVDYMNSFPETEEMLERIAGMLEYLFPRYIREGKSYCTVAIGCTGGRHRSVMLSTELTARLVALGYEVNLIHRDVHLQ